MVPAPRLHQLGRRGAGTTTTLVGDPDEKPRRDPGANGGVKSLASPSTSYVELARRIGRPGASRAVGGANGRNPISIIVPRHRVIGADGTLGGYGGGLDRKRWLLEHEAEVLARHPEWRPAAFAGSTRLKLLAV